MISQSLGFERKTLRLQVNFLFCFYTKLFFNKNQLFLIFRTVIVKINTYFIMIQSVIISEQILGTIKLLSLTLGKIASFIL